MESIFGLNGPCHCYVTQPFCLCHFLVTEESSVITFCFCQDPIYIWMSEFETQRMTCSGCSPSLLDEIVLRERHRRTSSTVNCSRVKWLPFHVFIESFSFLLKCNWTANTVCSWREFYAFVYPGEFSYPRESWPKGYSKEEMEHDHISVLVAVWWAHISQVLWDEKGISLLLPFMLSFACPRQERPCV